MTEKSQLTMDAEKLLQKAGLMPRDAGDPLSKTDLVRLVQWHLEGKSQVEIAEALGCNQSTVSRRLADFEQGTVEPARKLYEASQLRAAATVIERLDDEDGKVALRAAEIAHKAGKLIEDDKPTIGLQVVLGVPASWTAEREAACLTIDAAPVAGSLGPASGDSYGSGQS